MGSRLWLLARAKLTPETIELARSSIAESLAWMLELGIAVTLVGGLLLAFANWRHPTK